MNAPSKIPSPATIEAHRVNRAAIETNADKIIRLRRQCAAEKVIRVRGVMAGIPDFMEAWHVGQAEAQRIEREYQEMIAPLLPPAKDGTASSRDPVFDGGIASHNYFGRL